MEYEFVAPQFTQVVGFTSLPCNNKQWGRVGDTDIEVHVVEEIDTEMKT